MGVMPFSWLKTAEQHGVGRCAHKSPIMKRANTLKESSKKIYQSQREPLTVTDEFLEHSPSRGSLYYKWPTLQRIILILGGFFPRKLRKCSENL